MTTLTINGVSYNSSQVQITRYVWPDYGTSQPFVQKYCVDEPYWERLCGQPKTLVVFLHSWSSDYNLVLNHPEFQSIPNCALISPNFGGPNGSATTCGASDSLTRISNVIKQAKAEHRCQKVILIGYSGGGYYGLMMAGTHPELIDGGSLWLAIDDLAAWYAESPQFDSSLLSCFGGTPSQYPSEYLARSPKGVLQNCHGKKFIINSGANDTQVLPHHQVDAYNQLISAGNTAQFISWPIGHTFGSTEATEAVNQINSL